MKYSLFNASFAQEVVELFSKVFSASEGESEGQSIGRLVSNMMAKTNPNDLIGCVAIESGCIVGSIFSVVLLCPMVKLHLFFRLLPFLLALKALV